jgi:hypothetical protein
MILRRRVSASTTSGRERSKEHSERSLSSAVAIEGSEDDLQPQLPGRGGSAGQPTMFRVVITQSRSSRVIIAIRGTIAAMLGIGFKKARWN